MVDDRPEVAITTVASRLVSEAVQVVLGPKFIDDTKAGYGALSEHYWGEVCAEARRLAERIDVSDFALEASYEFLTARGAGR